VPNSGIAAQIWPVLSWAARHRRALTYGLLAERVGVPSRGPRDLLDPVRSYCLVYGLPPLTSVIVGQEPELASAPSTLAKVYSHDGLVVGCPTPEEFKAAAT
jgi:hypothetical protein